MEGDDGVNAQRLLSAEATVALIGVVASDLIQQGADRKLPRPRRLLAVFFFYGLLSLIASFGSGPARVAAAAGGVTALAALVLGTTGRTIISLIDRATSVLAPTPAPSPATRGTV